MSELLSQQESAATHDQRGKFARGNPLAWKPGQSGNPNGRPKGASFAGALARHALAPVSDREEMAKIAQTIGLDPEEARNIDVVAGLFYVVLCRALLRASGDFDCAPAGTGLRADGTRWMGPVQIGPI